MVDLTIKKSALNELFQLKTICEFSNNRIIIIYPPAWKSTHFHKNILKITKRSQNMEDFEATQNALARWEEAFRSDVKSDGYQILQQHLRNLSLTCDIGPLLDGTILFIRMSAEYLALDNQRLSELLEQQNYNRTNAVDAPYLQTFNICEEAYARISISASLKAIDLADLYGTPWNNYRVVGYSTIWISRADGEPLGPKEMSDFKKAVGNDLRFDYAESELDLWFDCDACPRILTVIFQDVPDAFETELAIAPFD